MRGRNREWSSGPDSQLPPDQTHFYLLDVLGAISTKGFTIFKESVESLDQMSCEYRSGRLGGEGDEVEGYAMGDGC